ncbi:DNA polymerase I [Halosquirtibacter xylanolyticus]|uniref:DNA polymerase I n=1 Tax=Halosquirtibacter xylanolyticus TaxID=3374599 RepID=UPI0037496B71|nr:DNA polymerase I [Prolixibacteraceae bacterium]
MADEKRIFLLDAYALIYRSYFAFIKNPRYNSKGLNTSAMLGFTNTLEDLLRKENPDYIAVVFDVHAPTFRHKMYPEYKANREAMPEDLRASIPYIRDIIKAYNIPIVESEGYEADDVIGTLSVKAKSEDFTTYMMTPDKDYAQLVNDSVFMYKPKRMGNDTEIWGIAEVCDKFGVDDPIKVIDILGLMGDSSDNIPGCPGVGPKSATKLINQFGSINGVYENISKLKGAQKKKLEENEEQVKLSRVLAEIMLDAPVDVTFDEMKRQDPNEGELNSIFSELEFRALIQKYNSSTVSKTPQEGLFQPQQGDLFGRVSQPSLFDNLAQEEVEVPRETIAAFENSELKYYLVDTPALRADLRADLCIQSSFCFDTETTGLDPISAEIVGISFSFKEGEAYYVPISSDRSTAKEILQEFASIFKDESIEKVGQNIKYDMLILLQYGLVIKGRLFDTMIAHYLLEPELRHNLDYLCEQYLNYRKIPTESLIGKKGKNQKSMRDLPVDEVCRYACEDADFTFRLKSLFLPKLKESNLEELFLNVEMPLVHVLAIIENNGVCFDTSSMSDTQIRLTRELIQLEKEIISLAGEEFNVSSPKQLGIILFEKLNLDAKAKKTKTNQYSTSEEVLVKLKSKHQIVEKVLEFRSMKKLLSTYVEALPKLINKRTGRIHTSFNQTVTATGRLSSNNPNLQNIPIRDAQGKEIRKAFVVPDEEHLFVSADYSQVELRIMAHLSQDEGMLEAFALDIDIHTATAAKIYKVSTSEVTSDMRRKAKTANFGIIYGISAFGLSQRLNISRSEAKDLIDGYFESFPKVKEFMNMQIEVARENQYVETILKRRRYLRDINSANGMVRGMAERNAINAPIQGSAADIIKIAMNRIQARIEELKLKSKMILQVHDELNFEVCKTEFDLVCSIIKSEMENAVDLAVPLKVDIGFGVNWLEAH